MALFPLFLIADRLLDCQPFNSKSGPVAWETSTVRSWLNGLSADQNTAGTDYQGSGFLDRAFSDTERQAILAADCQNKPNAYYGTDCGKDTQDYVFLLSNDQVFASDAAAEYGFYNHSGKDDPAKRFKSTMYAKCRGAWWSPVEGYKGNSFWFMRTSGYTPESVTYICDFGSEQGGLESGRDRFLQRHHHCAGLRGGKRQNREIPGEESGPGSGFQDTG